MTDGDQDIDKLAALEKALLDESADPVDLPFSLLKAITWNFSESQEIGEGGFAVVYKGLLPSGRTVAVKKLFPGIDMNDKYFKNEVEVACLAGVEQKHTVRLLGYCSETQQVLMPDDGKHVLADVRHRLLCFEYMPKGCLADYLSDASCGLPWTTRYQIIKGTCEGLHYLHQRRIIHMDLKPRNVLLDDNMAPRIADFSLSWRLSENQSWAITKDIVGTVGYMAPELMHTGNISFRTDIYSLGVIIMEILMGHKEHYNVEEVVESWTNKFGASKSRTAQEQVKVCAEIGIKCTNCDPRNRPATWFIISEFEKLGELEISKCFVTSDVATSTEGHSAAQRRVGNTTVLEESCLSTSSDVSMLFDGSVSASLGTMRPLAEKLDMLLGPYQEYSCLPKRIKDGMHLLKHDVEEISSYLDELIEVEDPPPMAKCWMNEARDLSYDMEDYIDSLSFVPPDRFIKKKEKKKRKKKMMIKKRVKWYKQIAFTVQVSEHGIKTSKIIHVNVPRLPRKPNIAETISEFRIYVQEAIERHDRYKLQFCSTLRRRFLSTGSTLPVPYEKATQIVIDGRMNEFINSLAANDAADQLQLKVVSVLGSGCLGKTTLANVLYDRIGIECRAFIRVSKKPDMKKIFHDLFSQLHPKKQPLPANCNELGISNINISKHLQDKRYLIVIDDLWDASVWDIIKYAFPKGNHGSRIIITTQIEDVALTCCCDHPEHVFEMKPLNDDHSRELFFNRLFGSEDDCPEEFKQVSNEIVDICSGLPLATTNIASHLANQATEISMDLLASTCDSLRSYSWSNCTSERTRQVLNVSYNNLPHGLKTCLLYLIMYQEGSIIFKDDLVKQWVAEGFIATREGKEQDQEWMEKAAGIYFDQLIDRRFIQPIYINYNNKVLACTVHDVVRDLIAHKSAEENFIVVIDYNRKNIALSHKVRRLSLVFGDAKYAKTPANITKSQVRSLRFFGLFACMPCIREFEVLRVLNLQLSGHCGDHDPIDLAGISELFQLRYLKIVSEACIKLPNRMRALQCLETLDVMDATRVTDVPCDIIHLPHLLHLTLPVDTNLLDWIGSMSDSVISLWSLGKLNYLQDLYLTISSTPRSGHPEKNMEALGYLLGGHGNLKNIVVSHGPSVKDIVVPGASKVIISWDDLEPLPLLRRFECSLHSCVIFSGIPKWVKELGNLCILKIAVMELQMSSVDILSGLPSLIDLSLYVQWAPGEKIIFDKAAGFSVLKYFKLRCTSGIPWLKFEADAMPNLWKLKLGFDAIPRMDQHQLIRIEHMPDLKEISVKFGGAAAHIEYAVRSVISNHPRNPTINMQSVKSSSYGDESTKQNLPTNWAPESRAAAATPMEAPTSHVTTAFTDSDSVSMEVADVEPLRRLSDNLATAFRSPDDFAFLADMHIAVPGMPDLHVHRYMLSARSPFLHAVFARRATFEGNRLELRELLGEEVEVGYEALQLVLEYLYSARIRDLPKSACVCVDMDGCTHVGCHPAVSFMVQVLFIASTFQVTELTNLFQRHLLHVLDDVEVDNLPFILCIANLCNKSCMKLLERCLEMVVRSNLDMITLEKVLPPDVIKQITDSRLSLGLVSPKDKGFPNKHVRRILKALDSDDVELVKKLLKEGQTNLDDAFALHYAVEHCDSKITTELLDIALADVNHRNPRGYTVLHIAARRRDPKIIVSLLVKGARPSDLTFDGRKAVQISKRLIKHGDYFANTEEGKPSSNGRLCIEILEQAERWDPQLGEASVSLALAGDCLRGKLLYLENRVALTRIMFPSEAKLAMDIAQVDGTLEFTLGSRANPPTEIHRPTVDLNETPFKMNDEHLARMRALSKTVELGKRFFPRCSNVLDKIMDDAPELASLGRDASTERKRRFHDLQNTLRKAFSEDKDEFGSSMALKTPGPILPYSRNLTGRRPLRPSSRQQVPEFEQD